MVSPIISAEWLNKHLNDPRLIILDASIKKVTDSNEKVSNLQIPYTRYFDIKNKFSELSAPFPNTVPSEEQFEKEAQALGINKDSIIIVYDDKGIYSSARAYWLLKAFGHNNVAILDGGLPKWQKLGYTLEEKTTKSVKKGNFKANYNPSYFKFFDDIKGATKDSDILILDARSKERFMGKVKEPRTDLRSGTIPNSKSLPYTSLLSDGCYKTVGDLKETFNLINPDNKHMIFSCGSGITACILALGAEFVGKDNISVYDGSWTEYGTLVN